MTSSCCKFAAVLLGATGWVTGAGAQVMRLDPHLDLPASATAVGWTGLTDPSSQFDLDRARAGGLTAAAVALYTPQGAPDAAGRFETEDAGSMRLPIPIRPAQASRGPLQTSGGSLPAGASR